MNSHNIYQDAINNDKFKNVVKKSVAISKDEIQSVKILGNGNCFYRCLIVFLII